MAQRKFRIVKRGAKKASGDIGVSGNDVREAAGDPGEDAELESSSASAATGDSASSIPDTVSGVAEESDSDIPSPSAVDPASIPARKRGRPKGSKNAASEPTQKASVKKQAIPSATFEQLLVGIHLGVATLLKTPELIIDQDEASVLREAFFKMADAYGWGLGIVSPKTEATINAAIAVSIVYGPKLKAAHARTKKPKLRIEPKPSPVPAGAD